MACSGQAGTHNPQPSHRPPSRVKASSVKHIACRGQAWTQAWHVACSIMLWTQRSPLMMGISIKSESHRRYPLSQRICPTCDHAIIRQA
jgi:hypothetical protein